MKKGLNRKPIAMGFAKQAQARAWNSVSRLLVSRRWMGRCAQENRQAEQPVQAGWFETLGEAATKALRTREEVRKTDR